MEIFILIIVVVLIYNLTDYVQKKQKEKEEAVRKWGTIDIGMSKDEVSRILGKPLRAWQADAAETWSYGSNDSDGVIRFLDGKVIAYQKPD